MPRAGLTMLLRAVAVCGALGIVLCFVSCDWQPVARPVQPEKLMDGPVRVVRMLDGLSRFAFIRHENTDGEVRYAISEWLANKHCDLPTTIERVDYAMLDPSAKDKSGPQFLLPIALRENGVLQLYLTDERCALRGPLGETIGGIANRASSVDGRTVGLFLDSAGTLSVIDPYREDAARALAQGVTDWEMVDPGPANDGPDALWILAEKKLVQRTLAGELLVSLGNEVSAFVQRPFDVTHDAEPNRVAYVDGGDLYEAQGPIFRPALRATDACAPVYRQAALELWRPCSAQQLVRAELFTGKVHEFADGVYASSDQAGLTFDFARDKEGGEHLFVASTQLERQEITTLLQRDRLLVLDQKRIAGTTADQTFGIWDLATHQFTALFTNVAQLIPFLDNRTGRYLWLMHHDVEGGIGTLSLFTQEKLTLETIAKGVPVRGYSIEFGNAIPQYPYPEPIVVLLDNAVPLSANPNRNKGRLKVQLLSGELGAPIADDVSSYAIVGTPLPGVLYAAEEGANLGLWFAAL